LEKKKKKEYKTIDEEIGLEDNIPYNSNMHSAYKVL